MRKILYLTVGCLSLGLGALGAALPILPTVPFLMLAAFCFARSSEKLSRWFRGTKLYRENLADFAAGKGMTLKTKLRILTTVTALMAVGMFLMGRKGITAGCVALACVWVCHIVYFVFGVKTIQKTAAV